MTTKFYGNSTETYCVVEGKIYLIQSVDQPIFTPIDYTNWGMPHNVEEVVDLKNDSDFVEIVKMCEDPSYEREDLYQFHVGTTFQTIPLTK